MANEERTTAASTSTTPASTTSAPSTAAAVHGPARPRGRVTLKEIFVSLESRDFRLLCASSLALGFGQWAQQVALPWLALALTGSAAQIGGIAAAQSGIGIVTAPFAGYLADRYPRRLVIIWSSVGSAIQASLLAALALSGNMSLWQLYALALAGGALQSLTQPARQSFVYDITTDDTLVNAITVNSLIQNFARIAGPPIAGAMIGFWGVGAAFIFLAACKVLAVVLTVGISTRTRQLRGTRGQNPLMQTWEGFRASWEDRRVLGLIVVHSIPTLLVIPYLPYLSVIAREHGGGATEFGLLTSMVGWGAVVGLFGLAAMRDPKRKGLLMMVTFIAYSTTLIAVANSPSLAVSMALLVVVGLVNSIGFALNNTLIQLAARNEVRGRVMGVWQLTAGFQLIGSPLMGFMIDRYGVGIGMGSFMAVATVVFVLFTLAWSSVRKM